LLVVRHFAAGSGLCRYEAGSVEASELAESVARSNSRDEMKKTDSLGPADENVKVGDPP
jgi:hypothetical protein